jgi:hypothetical protein
MGYSYDGPSKVITLTTGTTTVSVRDLWSRWVDWYLTGDNSKYLPALNTVGGNTIDPIAGTYIPIFAFLQSGWKLKPQEADHTLNIGDGILLVDGGGDPFLDTSGDYTVRINYQQPVQAITVSTGGGTAPTAEQVAQAVWATAVEGSYTALQLQRLISAILAGKTTITDTGDGTATVVFRDLNDSTNRVEADMDGSERLDITLTP